MRTIDYQLARIHPGELLLDLGCGSGRHIVSVWSEGLASGFGIDIAMEDLQAANKRYEEQQSYCSRDDGVLFAQAKGQSLPFADHSFDRIICSEVLEHIHDYGEVLDELNRVLRPGGTLGISVPRFFPEWLCWKLSKEYSSQEGGHVRIFKASALRKEIVGKGYRCYAKHWAHGLHSPYWWLKCLLWKYGDNNWMVRLYHRLLVWDLMKQPFLTRWLDRLLNPLCGKSVVLYFVKDINK